MCKESSQQYQQSIQEIVVRDRQIAKLQATCEQLQAELDAERAESARVLGVTVA